MVDIPDISDTSSEPLGLVKTVLRIADVYWTGLVDDPLDVLGQIELVLWAVRQAPSDVLAQKIYARYMATLGDIFAKAATAAGEKSTWDPEDLARTFIAIVDGASLQFIADPTADGHRDRFFRTLRLILADAVETDGTSIGQDGEISG
jgi:hypothetical protein